MCKQGDIFVWSINRIMQLIFQVSRVCMHVYIYIVITLPADDLSPNGARPSARSVMISTLNVIVDVPLIIYKVGYIFSKFWWYYGKSWGDTFRNLSMWYLQYKMSTVRCWITLSSVTLGQFFMPQTCENWLGFVNSCVYYARQTREIYHVLPYPMDAKALRELWNLLNKIVLGKCSFVWNTGPVTIDDR